MLCLGQRQRNPGGWPGKEIDKENGSLRLVAGGPAGGARKKKKKKKKG
jgi:hypothetical protein